VPSNLKDISRLYSLEKRKIKERLAEFLNVYKLGREEDLFSELVFCLLTPQSKAKNCWSAVEELKNTGKLFNGKEQEIASILQKKVRFHNNKARYVVEARSFFSRGKKIEIRSFLESFSNIEELREWLVKNIKGLGLKEAGHFLRNIGKGKNIAILDRHILKNLQLLGVIKELPKTLTKKTYLEIEKKMINFSKKIGIPEDHLDLVFWRKESGEYFK